MRQNSAVSRLPSSILRPMLATLIDAPFDDPAWVFEAKWDGFRVVARVEHGVVTLRSRNGKDVTAAYPDVVSALTRIKHLAVIDGELVALDRQGRSRFQLLQEARKSGARLCYCVFDLMYLDGRDVRRLPLVERKSKLRRILPNTVIVRFSRHIKRYGIRAFQAAQRRGLEGIMAKRAAGQYYSGRRTREWLKVKTANEQETVVIGFTRPRRSRKFFGALALAVRQGKSWRYVGHTGTGFNAASLKAIHAKLVKLAPAPKPVAERSRTSGQPHGCARGSSLRSNLPSGPRMAGCAILCFLACAPTKVRRRSCANARDARGIDETTPQGQALEAAGGALHASRQDLLAQGAFYQRRRHSLLRQGGRRDFALSPQPAACL
jgi:bifunctional non-homologous end joining protein LigD